MSIAIAQIKSKVTIRPMLLNAQVSDKFRQKAISIIKVSMTVLKEINGSNKYTSRFI
jgi:hypothetical protein|tara:strand:- start:1936 stop:2106 length:171 start_codon:yes stop_codon:yes gene_type:complete